jgi:putative FmdB family regulatory protein
MPLYSYDCLECKKNFNIRHAYSAKNVTCIFCNSEKIKKNLSNVIRSTKKCYNNNEQVGTEVNKAIEEGKRDLKKYQQKQKNRIHKKEQ